MTNAPNPQSPVAIIAGSGALPLEIAGSLTQKGEPVFICVIAGEGHESLLTYPSETLEWGQIGKLFRLLKSHRVERVVLAGGISGRPEITLRKMDVGTILTLPKLLASLLGGDNAILSGVISVFEDKGFQVCNIAEILPELVAPEGLIAGGKPSSGDLERIENGAALTHALSPFDVGQACVLIGRRAVAVEGVEGTDAMLLRVAGLRQSGRLPKKRGGVLVKAVKSGQDERADLPTIGPQTIENAHAAGLSSIGIEAGKTLIVEKERVLKTAKDLNICIFGFTTRSNGATKLAEKP